MGFYSEVAGIWVLKPHGLNRSVSQVQGKGMHLHKHFHFSFFFQGPQQNDWLVVLKKFLDTKLRLAWSLKSSCPCLWSTGITRPVTPCWLPERLFKRGDYCEKQICPRLTEAGGTLCYAHPPACSAGFMEALVCSSLVNMLEIHAMLPSMAR